MCYTPSQISIVPNGQPVTIDINMPPMGGNNIAISYKITINRSSIVPITGDNISNSDDSNMILSSSPQKLVGKLMLIEFFLPATLDSKKNFSFEVFQGRTALTPQVTHDCSKALQSCTVLFK